MALPSLLPHLGAYIALAGGAPLFLVGFRGLREAWSTKAWPSVEGRILSASALLNSSSEISDSYSPNISYEYVVNGTVHRGTRVMAGVRTFHLSYPTAADALGDHRVGRTCLVYYNPADPGRAVLRPGATFMHYVMPALGAMLCAGGLAGLAWG